MQTTQLTQVARCRYFSAYELPSQTETRQVVLVNNRSKECLGYVKWYAPWRQFCFYPIEYTVWSDGCLADVRKLIGNMSKERRAAKATGVSDE